jgi:hypothetical protein
MRKASVGFLTIAGVVGLVTALSFQAHGGGVSRPGAEGPALVEPMSYRVGVPDAWLVWESGPDGRTRGVYLLRWSFAILVASVCALCCAARLSWRTPSQEPAAPRVARDDSGG